MYKGLVIALGLAVMSGAAASAAVPEDSSGIPVADGEQQARTCYLHAQNFWNTVMASSPRDRKNLMLSYKAFAGCAKVAIDTGKTLPNGQRLPWVMDYFA